MGWETRKNGVFYYRKERTGGKTRSVYVGNNETAQLIAQLDECYRWRDEAERLEKAEKLEKIKAAEVDIDGKIEKLSALNRDLVDALFLINGYRQHDRGEWRRKRK